MSDASQHEQLLSAYLDGQLNPQQQKQAEKLLADNPRYASLLKQWKDQGQQIRELPRFELGNGFSDRVMNSIKAGATAWPAGSKALGQSGVERSSRSGRAGISPAAWRTAAAAIMTLAAMMLLTLFAFPSMMEDLPIADAAGVSSKTKIQAEGSFDDLTEQVAVDTDLESEKSDDAFDERMNKKSAGGSKFANKKEAGPTGLAKKKRDKETNFGNGFGGGRGGEPGTFDMKQSRGGGGLRGDVPDSIAELTPNEKPGAVQQEPATSSMAVPEQDQIAQRDQVILKNQMSQQAIARNAVPISIGNNPPIEEILVIEMADSSSKQRFQQALQTNNIQVQTNYGYQQANNQSVQRQKNAPSGNGQSSKDAVQNQASELADLQASDGLEAWYIRSSARQINQAINELSEQADISLVQVPPSVANAFSTPNTSSDNQPGFGSDQPAAQPAPLEEAQPEQKGAAPAQIMANRNNNYAQQLTIQQIREPAKQSDGVNQIQARRRNSDGSIPDFNPEESVEPLDLPTDNELANEIAAVNDFFLGTNPDQVRNFLLLVQTRPESAKAKSSPKARKIETAGQSGDAKPIAKPADSAAPQDK